MRGWLEALILRSSLHRQGRNVVCLLMALPVVLMAGENKPARESQPASHPPAADPGAARAGGNPASQARLVESYGKLPLRFEANQGQTDRQVKFLSRGRGYGLFLTPNEVVLSLQGGKSEVKSQKSKVKGEDPGIAGLRTPNAESRIPAVLRMNLVGANPNPEVRGDEELAGKSNYFIGNDPKLWRTGVANYAKVRYTKVYPGVDLVYYGNQGQLEYDWIVAPGADPKAIRFAIEGTEKVSVDAKGNLVLKIEGGEVRFHKPVVYQEESGVGSQEPGAKGHRQFLDGRYVLTSANPKSQIPNPKWEVGFEIASYDAAKPLVIDPTLSYATYLGGGAADYGLALRVLDDGAGGAYAFVAGRTTSVDFPPNPPIGYDPTCGTDGACNPIIGTSGSTPVNDGFVAKLSADGASLLYSTYLGGSGYDEVDAVAVDSAGNAYVSGLTFSVADFPVTAGAYTTANGTLFVTKLNAAGSGLVYSARFGGIGGEQPTSIALDSSGNAYLGGYTYSTDFPTTVGSLQETSTGGTCGISSTFACPHGYVARLSADGSTLDYSTYLGGSQADYVFGVAVDGSGNAYTVGVTQSSDFPNTAGTSGAYQGTFGGETTGCDAATTLCGDTFITKLNANLSGPPVFSTFLGGSGDDVPGLGSIALDGSGNVFVGGQTNSANFPVTSGAYQTNLAGSEDAFVAEIDSTGTSLSHSTFLGGTGVDVGQNLARDTNGNIYVSGYTLSTDFPTASPLQGSCASCANAFADAFVAKFNSTLSGLIFSDYLGGTGTEDAFAIAVDSSGHAYVAGSTDSTDFPVTTGAFQGTSGGGIDAYVGKYSGLALPVVTVSPASYDFGRVNVGTLAPFEPITITNLGDATLNFSSFNVGSHPTLPGFADFTSSDSLVSPCGSSLAAGASCVRNIFFQPTAVGNEGAVFTITDDSGGVSGTFQTVTLTGTGVAVPHVSLDFSSLFFGDQIVGTSSGLQTITLTNTGTGPLTISNLVASGNYAIALPNTPGPTACQLSIGIPLAASASCRIPVAFSPTALGERDGSITITSDDPVTPSVVADLFGFGVSAGVAGGLPANFSFGSLLVGRTSPVHTFTLTNSGTGTMGITFIVATGSFQVSGGTCPFSGALAASASCTIKVAFLSESPGTNSGSLVVGNDGAGSPAVVALTGTGTVLPTNPLLAFTPKKDYTTGTTPFGGDAEDFNGDGKVDLVIANYGSNNVTVFLGNGDGTFQTGVNYPAGTNPTSVTARDINGDGIIDLIVTDQNAATPSAGAVQLLAGNGDGTFQAAVSLGTFNGPNSVAVGDFNNDGIRDLAVAEGGGGSGTTVAVLLGTGGGNFQSPVQYTVPVNPDMIERSDFNNDGYQDLAVLSNIGQLSILLGNGDGTFQNAVSSPTGSFPNGRMAIADFNGDGYDDIAVAQNGSNSVGVFLNNGSGAFPTRTDLPATGARAVTTADFNGDGKFDLAVASQSTGSVLVFLGNGDGTFPIAPFSFPASPSPTDIGGLDLNGDGMPDIAVAGSLSVLLNTAAQVSPTSIDFGSQLVGSTSAEQTVTLTNASNSVNLNVGGITPSGDFSDTTETCTLNPVPPGGNCTIKANFTPTDLLTRTGTLSISTDAVGTPHIIQLTGTGTGTPAVSLSPAVNFPGNPVGVSCPVKTVTLSNTGNIPLAIDSITATAPFTASASATNTCPATLAVGTSCDIAVNFSPSAVTTFSGTLTVTTTPATAGNTIGLTGTGTPHCTLLAAVHTATLLRGADAQDFAIEDGRPSCSPVNLNLSCSVANPAACALNPAVIAPSGSSTLRVSNLRAVTADSVQVTVNSVSEFRAASELLAVRFADFAFTQAPDTATIRAGGTASYSVAIRPINGLAGSLALACSGAPRGATCSVTPSTVTLDGTSLAQVRVQVSTTARAGAGPGAPFTVPPLGGLRGLPLTLLAALLALMLGVLAQQSRRVKEQLCATRTRLVLAVAMLAMLLWASCGGGGSMNFTSGGTPAGTFTLTVTGTYSATSGATPGTLTNSTSLTLKVN